MKWTRIPKSRAAPVEMRNIQHDLQKDNTIWDYKMQITYLYNILPSGKLT